MNITVDNLKKTFGDKTAVDITSLSISSGEMLGLVGNNGAGKTTFFRLLLDLIRADEGSVAYVADAAHDGLAINPAESEDWKEFTSAYIDEGFLIDFLTPEEFFEFVGKASGIDAATVGERLEAYRPFMADEILGQQKYIRNFSAGNKQKIGIIAALLNRPQI
ncbi:MAG: ATP-binding cassette domain-containing protein, partial [Prevotella sp.]|nr:ATP-binding cassette domain-containing protein [Prevotella sp.]